MTTFQKRIRDFLRTEPNQYASTWRVAAGAFPEKWARRAARGALVGHIRRAAYEMEGDGVFYTPGATQHDCGSVMIVATAKAKTKSRKTHDGR